MPSILLVGHGSRDPLWAAPFEAVAARIRQKSPGTLVVCGYLELCQPNVEHAAGQLIAQGASRIRLVPLFLGAGKHVRDDLPQRLLQLQRNHPEQQFSLQNLISDHPALIALLADMALTS